jgi:hypothetical protein
MSVSIKFKEFDFGGLTTFLSLDVTRFIVELAKAYRDIEPIADGSVEIYIDDDLVGNDATQFLSSLLQSGTKPMNAIMYMHAKDNQELNRVFVKFDAETSNLENQTEAIRLLVAGLTIFISRGQWPATQGNNANTPLPKFCTNVLKIKAKNEKQLRDMLMDFDPKHINFKIFDDPENFKGWDLILQNRFKLGVAGHKPLKAIELLYNQLDVSKKDTHGFKILEALHQASKVIEKGFYPNLHPSIQTFSSKYSQFYKNTIRLIFENMTGSEDKRHETLMNLPMFKPDLFVKNELRRHNPNISNWNVEEMIKDLGKPILFGDSKQEHADRTNLKFGTSQSHDHDIQKVDDDLDEEDEGQTTSTSIQPTTKKQTVQYGQFEQKL